MTQERKINHSQYQKAAALLSQLFEFDSDIEKKINAYVQHNGICYFFENLEDFELDVDTTIKLQAVRDVLFGLGLMEDRPLRGGVANNV